VSKDRRLGKGLAALLGASAEEMGAVEPTVPRRRTPEDTGELTQLRLHAPNPGEEEAPASAEPPHGGILKLEVTAIDDNPFQPRRKFDEAEIASLAESLQEHDMLQPILVRRTGERYQLISGERRLRAAVKAGWTTIPAQVREADDRLVAELALVENLQREDLNAIDKAMSFQRYIAQHQCTQEELAGRVKINRATIANFMRLLELPDEVQTALADGKLTAGHARALLPLGEEGAQVEFCRTIERDGLSVRDVERMVKERIDREDGAPAAGESPKPARTRSEHLASLEQELRTAVGAKVDIRQSAKGRGRIVIHFKNHEEFERVFNFLTETVYEEPLKKAG
jgi:ParB family transcriptional regulator, chromosome partitioning protein